MSMQREECSQGTGREHKTKEDHRPSMTTLGKSTTNIPILPHQQTTKKNNDIKYKSNIETNFLPYAKDYDNTSSTNRKKNEQEKRNTQPTKICNT